MATLTDYGVKDGTTIGNPSSGNFYRFMDSNNSNALTLRDSAGVDEVYTTGVIPETYDKRIMVKQSNVATTLGGTIDSTAEYFVDGVIDMTGVTVTVPPTGLFLTGYDSEVSQLVCTDNIYTMFDKPLIGGSGNLLMKNLAIEVSGTSSRVFNLVGDTGFEAIETSGVNYNNCTSRGEISTYRQGLDENLGIFGGTPSLTLSGTWVGGYRLSTTIVRSITDSFTGALFEEGTSFVMNSRFLTDWNVDLGTNGSLVDFRPANFNGSSLLQFKDCIVSRNGVIDATDTNLTPNIAATDLQSIWRNNQGLNNTYVGCSGVVVIEVPTVILVSGTFYLLAGTFTLVDPQHFDSPANNQFRNLGRSPRDFQLAVNLVLDGGANDEYTIRIRKYDASAATTSTVVSQTRAIQNSQGGADVTAFSILANTTLDINDYVFLEVANITDISNCTALSSGFINVKER